MKRNRLEGTFNLMKYRKDKILRGTLTLRIRIIGFRVDHFADDIRQNFGRNWNEFWNIWKNIYTQIN